MHKIILTKEEMVLVEKHTMTSKKITSFDLMHQAATACFNKIKTLNLIDKNTKVLVVAGSGHNGGDAILLAHLMARYVNKVTVYLTDALDKYQGDTKEALLLLKNVNIMPQVLDPSHVDDFILDLNVYHLLIDGIYGTGFRKPLSSDSALIISLINQSSIDVVALDIPSGIMANSGIADQAIIAKHTLAIGYFKPGHYLWDAKDFCGELHCIDIGLLKPNLTNQKHLLETSFFKQMIPKRKHNTHKYHYGNLVVVGGSVGMMGAPYLSAHAAYRTGCGLVRMLLTKETYPHRYHLMPELMYLIFDETSDINKLLIKKTGVAFGMGLDDHKIYLKLLKSIMINQIPVVIDAGGLTHLKNLLPELSIEHPVVITPHIKELSDLLSVDIQKIKEDPIKTVENFAATHHIVTILKGPTTIITDGKQTYLLPFGNPGLAKAGSGDVLSGIIGALLAQNMHALEASLLGVYILGSAANITRAHFGEDAMMASDVISHIKDVLITLKE